MGLADCILSPTFLTSASRLWGSGSRPLVTSCRMSSAVPLAASSEASIRRCLSFSQNSSTRSLQPIDGVGVSAETDTGYNG